jgi:hypothetical protein
MKYSYYVYDNIINDKLQKEIWQHLLNQTYFAKRKSEENRKIIKDIIQYKPIDNKKEYLNKDLPNVNDQNMHRTTFGNNEEEIKIHPPISQLWNKVKEVIGAEWNINGDPEGIVKNPNLIESRVYVNIQPTEEIKKSHAIHRDTTNINETNNYTLLYIANPEWHPSWFAENIFYEDDESSLDRQQFQYGHGQSRNFGIGDPYAIISPKPGRVILYDGRTLHTTRPAAIWAKEMRYAVAFRIRKTR